MTTVKIQNINPTSLKQWVMRGLPTPVEGEQHLLVGGHRAYARGHELHVFADMAGASEQIHEIALGDALGVSARAIQPFRFHPWVVDDLGALIPTFNLSAGAGEGRDTAQAVVLGVEHEGVVIKAHLRALVGLVTVDLYYRIYTDSAIVEYVLDAVYGTTAPGQPRTAPGALSMTLGEFACVDFAVAKGLHAPMWSMVGGNLRWEVELCAPMDWHRAGTVQVFGAVLCLPSASKFPQLTGDPEVANLVSRMFAPIEMMVDPAEWRGAFTPLGALPKVYAGARGEQARRVSIALQRLATPGSEQDPRRYAQPPNSGQTGEQPDFGYARCEHALAMWEPWAIWELRYHAQAWKLRPYANKERDGSPVLAENHPDTQTYNLRPDERFSRDDMLGWPAPVGWISGYTTSDSQHRSDNMLFGLYRLTRCPSLRSTILDILELEKMAYGRGFIPPRGSGLGAPRGWGRVLYSRLQGVVAGFSDFEPLAREMVAAAHVAASHNLLSNEPALSVRVLSDNEEKYGWKDADGVDIRCWLPWQEAIASVAFFAAWRVLGMTEARNLALVTAKTICRHAYFKVGAEWHVCYGVRWRTDQPGAPLPDSAYNLNQPNFDVYVTGMQRWTNPALKLLIELDPNANEAARAREILAFYGEPQSWDDSCWGAVS